MAPEDLLAFTRRKPFLPFRIRLSDGTIYKVRHPELLMVGGRSIIIGFPENPADHYYHRYETVSMNHIVRAELIEEPAHAEEAGQQGT